MITRGNEAKSVPDRKIPGSKAADRFDSVNVRFSSIKALGSDPGVNAGKRLRGDPTCGPFVVCST